MRHAAVRVTGILLVLLAFFAPPAAPARPVTARLVTGGVPLPVVVSAGASAGVKDTAQRLAEYLSRMSGAAFAVTAGPGASGIAVGLPGDFPAVKTGVAFDAADPLQRERYLLRSHARGLYLIGATEAAVRDAAWDLLGRLGYRQYFPGPTWEIVPKAPAPAIAVDAVESPDYYSRRIWYGFGTYPENMARYNDWCAKNRATESLVLNTGHSYGGIIREHRAEFVAHPEYLALVKGARTPVDDGDAKFCIANAGLRQLVVAHCLQQFAANPALDSTSLDPSDGGGWCECDACAKMGSVSDRVVTLANEAARAVNARYPGKYIGIYAYNLHSPPPAVRVDPHVIVSVATAFISGFYTVDGLLDGWRAQGATAGIREYYSVNTWDRNLPGSARGCNLDYLQRTIPHFYDRGARFMSSESGDCWALNGFGYYFAARMLWDVGEAKRREAILSEFLENAFGPARGPMQAFFARLEGSRPPLLSTDLVGRLYRDLQAARALAPDPRVQARLDELVLYVRYVELYRDYDAARGPDRLKALEAVCRFAWRIRGAGMVHSLAIYRDVPARDRSVTAPAECDWEVPEAKNPWKQNPPLTREEIASILDAGIARNALVAFTPAAYSARLVPAAPLRLPAVPDGMPALRTRFDMTIYTAVPPGAGKAALAYSGNGRIFTLKSLDGRGTAEAIDLRRAEMVAGETPATVTLTTARAGLHALAVGGSTLGSTTVQLLDGLPMTVDSDNDFVGRWYLYFYVPKGTKVIGGYSATQDGVLLDPDGKEAFSFASLAKPDYFSVPVPPGQDGRLWKMHFCAGMKKLLTVPPYYARNAAELLLPAEVVEKDAGR